MALGIAIDRARVEAADYFDAHRERAIHHLEHARRNQQPRLREGDDLDVDRVAVALAGRHHALDSLEPDLGIDVDVAADVRGAEGERLHDLTRRLARRVDAHAALEPPLVLDLVDQTRPDV